MVLTNCMSDVSASDCKMLLVKAVLKQSNIVVVLLDVQCSSSLM